MVAGHRRRRRVTSNGALRHPLRVDNDPIADGDAPRLDDRPVHPETGLPRAGNRAQDRRVPLGRHRVDVVELATGGRTRVSDASGRSGSVNDDW